MADIELKGGQTTTDPRLDRIEHFDDRSQNFPVNALLRSTSAPRSYTWKGGPVTDQGREGACVGHGWTGELTARPKPCKIDGPDAYAHALYKEAQQIDAYPGDAYSGTDVLAGAKVLAVRGLIKEYRWAFGLQDVLLAIGYKGPVVLGIPWYESMYSAPNGVLTVSGRKVGGHCILARGVNMKTRSVLLRNSWGVDWGQGGDAWIGFDALDGLLNDGGEACVPVYRSLA